MGDIIEKIFRWLKYGVVLSFAPLVLVWLLSTIIGYDINIMDAIPDILLIGFAVAVNALCYETDDEKNMKKYKRKIFQNISRFIMVVCLVLYFGLFNGEILGAEIRQQLETRKQIVFFVGVGVFISVLVNALLGVLIEIDSSKNAGSEP